MDESWRRGKGVGKNAWKVKRRQGRKLLWMLEWAEERTDNGQKKKKNMGWKRNPKEIKKGEDGNLEGGKRTKN